MLTCHMGWSYCYKETIKQDKRVVHGLGGVGGDLGELSQEVVFGSYPFPLPFCYR